MSRESIGIPYSAPAEIGAKLEIEPGLPLDGGMTALKVHGVASHSQLKGSLYYSVLKLPKLSDKDSGPDQPFYKGPGASAAVKYVTRGEIR